MIEESQLLESGIVRYDHPNTVIPWKDAPGGKLPITGLWGKNGAFIYKDHKGYYGLGRKQIRVDLHTINEAEVFVNS